MIKPYVDIATTQHNVERMGNMANTNRGKQFENIVRDCLNKVADTTVIRLHDQTTGFQGSKNPCDLVVYHHPNQYLLECKSTHGNTLPLSNITDFQYSSLLEFGTNYGCIAGILCWWIDNDVTKFIPIDIIKRLKDNGAKSIRYDYDDANIVSISGVKKRVFFDYDFADLFDSF